VHYILFRCPRCGGELLCPETPSRQPVAAYCLCRAPDAPPGPRVPERMERVGILPEVGAPDALVSQHG